MKKILILHNIVAPYRSPIFYKLSEICDLKVVYLKQKDTNRKWDQSFTNDFDQIFLKSITIKIFGKNICFSYGAMNIINKFKPDILILPDDPPHIIYTLYLSITNNKIKKYIWSGNFEHYNPFKNRLINSTARNVLDILRFIIYKNANKILVYSKYNVNFFSDKYKIDAKHILPGLQGYPDILINNKIKINVENRFRGNIICFVGYLSERKGIDILINAVNNIQKNREVKLMIIGDFINNYQYKFNNYNNIIFCGYKEGKEKFELMNKAKILVLPSHSDPWGWVINEASSIKIPCIISNHCMAKEIAISDDYIFEDGNITDLQNAIIRVLDMDLDEYLKTSEQFYFSSRAHNEEKTLNMFRNLINN